MSLPKYDSDIPPGHPSEEKRDLHPGDRYLRLHGFKIERRPTGGQAVWSRGGRLYTQAQAIALCDRDFAEAADQG